MIAVRNEEAIMASWISGVTEAVALLFFIGSVFWLSHIAVLGGV